LLIEASEAWAGPADRTLLVCVCCVRTVAWALAATNREPTSTANKATAQIAILIVVPLMLLLFPFAWRPMGDIFPGEKPKERVPVSPSRHAPPGGGLSI
jgi:hypothetical protein